MAFVGDRSANVYALDASTGVLIWKSHVDNHQFALHDGFLEDGAGKIVDAILRRIGANSTVFNIGAVVEHQDLIALYSGQP